VIHTYSPFGRRKTLLYNWANLRKWSEKRGFFGGKKQVNTCMERDKKNLEKMDFCSYLPALLIDFALARREAFMGC